MGNSQAYIRDIGSLHHMSDTMDYCADSLLKLIAAVDAYFNNVINSLKDALGIVKAKLDEAKERLEEAESALESCEASQYYDEEEGEYVPSCNYEAAQVSRCREEVTKWQEKYDQGKQIVDDTQKAVDDYHHRPSGLTSPGGECLIHSLATDTCQKGMEKMGCIINKLEDFVNFQILEPGSEIDPKFHNEHRSDDDMPLDDYDKERRLKDAFHEVRKEQSSDSSYYNVADANGIMVCKDCGRPFALCVCKKS